MRYQQNKEYDLRKEVAEDCKYIVSSHHRNENPKKSIWTISCDKEVYCFINSYNLKWFGNKAYWGVLVDNEEVQVIGKVIRENNVYEHSKIAKFVNGKENKVWHGYPADYLLNKNDIPTDKVLRCWEQKKYIKKHQIRKIQQQKPCNL